jgi:2'-5' RNA ligase
MPPGARRSGTSRSLSSVRFRTRTPFWEDIRVALRDAGFPIDERPFRPHLTISYRYDRSIATILADYAGPPWPVEKLALVQSADGDYLPVWEHRLPR